VADYLKAFREVTNSQEFDELNEVSTQLNLGLAYVRILVVIFM